MRQSDPSVEKTSPNEQSGGMIPQRFHTVQYTGALVHLAKLCAGLYKGRSQEFHSLVTQAEACEMS